MNRAVAVLATPAVRVERFDHPPGETHRDPECECAAGHALNFIEAGSFRLRPRGGAWRAIDARHLFATTPGLEFSCAHEHEQPSDRCLSICYSEAAIESLRADGGAWSAPPLLDVSNRTAYLRHQLTECGAGDEARAETLAGALLWAVAGGAPLRPAVRADRHHWYAVRVDRAKALMQARFEEPLSLTTLARDAGMGVYHFARVFAELEGVPPHRYLSAIRMARARTLLLDGASVTEASLAVGFGSLSHFVTAFRRRFGVRPGDLLRSATAARRSAIRRPPASPRP